MCVSTEKALFEAWDRQIAELAGLGMAFPCVPTHSNACPSRSGIIAGEERMRSSKWHFLVDIRRSKHLVVKNLLQNPQEPWQPLRMVLVWPTVQPACVRKFFWEPGQTAIQNLCEDHTRQGHVIRGRTAPPNFSGEPLGIQIYWIFLC